MHEENFIFELHIPHQQFTLDASKMFVITQALLGTFSHFCKWRFTRWVRLRVCSFWQEMNCSFSTCRAATAEEVMESSSLQMTPNWEDQSTYWSTGLPSRQTYTGWRNGSTRLWWKWTRRNAKPCTQDRRPPCNNTGWRLPGWGAGLLKGPGGAGREWAEHEPTLSPCSKASQQCPVLYGQEHSQKLQRSDYPLYSTLIRPQWDTVSSFQPPNTRKTSINWSKFRGGPPRGSEAGALALSGEAGGAGFVQLGEEMAWGDLHYFMMLSLD